MANVLVGLAIIFSLVNVVLGVQNFRWAIYWPFTRSLIPTTYYEYYPLVELSGGLIIGAVLLFWLVYLEAFKAWGLRESLLGAQPVARALLINSVVLFLLALIGILQWLFVFRQLVDLSLVPLMVIGLAAALFSYIRMSRQPGR